MSKHGHDMVGSNNDTLVFPGILSSMLKIGAWPRKNMKVHLVSALKQNTLSHLDMYITRHVGYDIACLETIQDRLHYIPYV